MGFIEIEIRHDNLQRFGFDFLFVYYYLLSQGQAIFPILDQATNWLESALQTPNVSAENSIRIKERLKAIEQVIFYFYFLCDNNLLISLVEEEDNKIR